MQLPSTEDLAAAVAADGELMLALRHWTGGVRLACNEDLTGFTVKNGSIEPGICAAGPETLTLRAPLAVWEAILAPVLSPGANSVALLVAAGVLELEGDPMRYWQYLPALERLVELLRSAPDAPSTATVTSPAGQHDTPTGHYVHVTIDGVDHRIYYETAGVGIPLLLQHTAGAHSVQWRHLFEVPEITDHFQLVAYDLPFHGKSIPAGRMWWAEEYKLTGEFLRQVPIRLSSVLNLQRPVFMGCSVGGLLALDLAYHHPDRFRAVISLEGSLYVGGDLDALVGLWSPQVSNTTKARMMEGLCAPTSPPGLVKEVSQAYSAGWPPAFLGDLYYYMVDYDLRKRASDIDTARCAVHILNGEYDWSATPDMGVEAHQTIAGSTYQVMSGVGHFPMQENPEVFLEYLLPVLRSIPS